MAGAPTEHGGTGLARGINSGWRRGDVSLKRSASVMALGTITSRILGFVRILLLGLAIGEAAGSVSASFQVANSLPNTIFNILAAGLLDAILVPQIVRALKSKSGSAYINRLITLAGTLLFLVTVLAMVCAPLLVSMMAADFSGEMRQLTIAFTIVCLPQVFFYGIYSLFGEVLNAQGIFGPYMWAPVVNNVIGIAGLGAFLWLFGTSGGSFAVQDLSGAQFWLLGLTATLGVFAQAIVLLIPLKRSGVRLRLDFHFRGNSFTQVSSVVGWTVATLLVSQIGIISTSQLATRADAWVQANPGFDGTIAGYMAYTVTFMIFMVPQSVISVSIATAIFTRLANAAADQDHESVATHFEAGVNLISKLLLLCAAVIIAISFPLMQLILMGASYGAVRAYALLLTALMPGVAAIGIVLMSQRFFFAQENAKPVFIMGIVPTVLQVAVGWTIYSLTDAEWWTFGAAVGETTCRITQGVIAIYLVGRYSPRVKILPLPTTLARYVSIATVAMAAGLALLLFLGPFTHGGTGLSRVLPIVGKIVLITALVTLVYFALDRITKVPKLHTPQHSSR